MPNQTKVSMASHIIFNDSNTAISGTIVNNDNFREWLCLIQQRLDGAWEQFCHIIIWQNGTDFYLILHSGAPSLIFRCQGDEDIRAMHFASKKPSKYITEKGKQYAGESNEDVHEKAHFSIMVIIRGYFTNGHCT